MRKHLSIFIWTVLALGLCSNQNTVSGGKEPSSEVPQRKLMVRLFVLPVWEMKDGEVDLAIYRLMSSANFQSVVMLDTDEKRLDAKIVLNYHKKQRPHCDEMRDGNLEKVRQYYLDELNKYS